MDTMKAGDSLDRGNSMKSPNGRFELKMQTDGNVVLYDGTKPTWATNTQRDDGQRLDMQDDGNLVVYAGKKAVWSSKTLGNKGASLKLQDDGNLVLYPTSGKPLWSSHTMVKDEPAPAGTTMTDKAMNAPAAPVAKPAVATNATAPAVAMPVAKAATPAAKAANKRTYTVAKGDSLWRIAEKMYGNGSDFKKIAKANNISNPDLIRPGQELVIPE
jgi:LysM repeat protein